MYRTVTQEFNELNEYGLNLNILSNNLYNRTLFIIRQMMTGYKKDNPCTNEQEVLDLIKEYEAKYNEYNSKPKLKKDGNEKKTKSKKEFKPVHFDKDNWMPGYKFLNFLLSESNDVDYRALPVHTSQKVIKQVVEVWKSYFNALKEYKKYKEKFTGVPKVPKYHKKGSYNVATISNISGKIENGLLVLPGTKIRVDVSKLVESIKTDYDLKLLNIKVKVQYGKVFYKFTFEERKDNKPVTVEVKEESKKIASIDLGVNNIIACTNNIGLSPILIKGDNIKSFNKYINKEVSRLQSILKTVNGTYNSRRINRLWEQRDVYFKNKFGKISNYLVDYLKKNDFDTLVVGKNSFWKQDANLGKTNNQNFCYIPFNNLLFMLKYKCEANGIKFVEVEESYTSKSSFLDNDKLPNYSSKKNYKFKGNRIKRGLYRTEQGILINADVNGSLNILRKYDKDFKLDNFKTVLNPNVKRM